MVSPTIFQPPHGIPLTNLTALPPEIRTVIYARLCDNLCLKVSRYGILSLEYYPWQLSAVSRLIKSEMLPILRGKSQTHRLRLVCEYGRFPDQVRRRIPNEVLEGISIITVLDMFKYDDIKPSLRAFPNLSELRLAPVCLNAPNRWGRDYLAAQVNGESPPPVSEDEVKQIIHDVKHTQIMNIAAELKREQERPREGLERDYLVEGTLYQTLEMERWRRGFDVKVEALLIGYEETVHMGHDFCGMIRIDDWDLECGSHINDLMTDPLRLYV